MLTYQLKKQPGLPLYEALYRCIREDIRTGKLRPGEQLPSKRSLCANLKVSKITVENAYNQLLAEGYISSREKVGYFVEAAPHRKGKPGRAASSGRCCWTMGKSSCCPFPTRVSGSCARPLPGTWGLSGDWK